MARFLARRLAMAIAILVVLSFTIYGLLDFSVDYLWDLRQSTSPAKQQLIDQRVALLHLDQPWTYRYWSWLTKFVQGDFGLAWATMRSVNDMLPGAILTSVQLVFASTLLAILTGVTVGVVSALRQYTGFDYAITFVAFLLYALPVFWVAVLLKNFLAIGFNDYLGQPTLNWPVLIALSVVSGLFWMGALGGRRKRKVIVFASAFAVTLGLLALLLLTGWVLAPQLGIVGVALVALGMAVAQSALFAGLSNRRALYSALTTAGVGIALYLPLQWLFYYVEMSWPYLLGLLASALAIACLVGWLWGGPDRGVSMRGAAVVALFTSVATYIDRILQVWPEYMSLGSINGRPIPTIGAVTPGLQGDFWLHELDRWTHLLLPTIALVMISFAAYTRYQRSAMLEVMNQDYIRTARAKGLPERVVIVRHALRNALLPLASIIPVDFVSLIGGAVITETIFGWAGMGRMFVESLSTAQLDPVMAYVMITGSLAMFANLAADFLYSVLDPRIRVNA